jgi:bla regulator protein BlaR1
VIALMEPVKTLFTWVWQASWQAGVVILLVLAAQRLFRKQLSPGLRHGLWLLVVIRLLLPASVSSPLSVFNWVAMPQAKAAVVTGAQENLTDDLEHAPPSESTELETKPTRTFGWSWLSLAWLAGVLGLSAFVLLGNLRIGRVLRQRPTTNEQLLNLLEDCKEQMRVRTPMTVVETAAVGAPALLGFIRPRLLLPGT